MRKQQEGREFHTEVFEKFRTSQFSDTAARVMKAWPAQVACQSFARSHPASDRSSDSEYFERILDLIRGIERLNVLNGAQRLNVRNDWNH